MITRRDIYSAFIQMGLEMSNDNAFVGRVPSIHFNTLFTVFCSRRQVADPEVTDVSIVEAILREYVTSNRITRYHITPSKFIYFWCE